MGGAGIGHDTDIGPRDAGQVGDVSRSVAAHLDDGEAVRGVEAGQGQRHAELVVVIALRGQGRPLGRQDGGDHFLDRRLAVAAGNADDGHVETLAPGPGNPPHRRLHVLDEQLRQGILDLAADQRRFGAVFAGLAEELVAIVTLAGQRAEQVAGLDATGVVNHAADLDVRADHPTAGQFRHLRKAEVHHAATPSAARTLT